MHSAHLPDTFKDAGTFNLPAEFVLGASGAIHLTCNSNHRHPSLARQFGSLNVRGGCIRLKFE